MLLYLFCLSLCLNTANLQWTTPTEHDFGEIERGKAQTIVFTFKNISDKPIVVDNVRTDCGCTASDWDNTPVSPTGSGKITITFDAVKEGYFRKKITVWLHKQKKAEVLYIEGEVLK
jgi:Protein of unknown function (DUF1573)